MKRMTISLLIVVTMMVLLTAATVTFAQGQTKTSVCHLNGDGTFIPITIADPALDAHKAHGDLVVGVDVDENCEPLGVVPQSGCLIIYEYNNGHLAYGDLDGSFIQPFEYIYLDDPACSNPSQLIDGEYIYIWAADLNEARAICDSYFSFVGSNAVITAPVPNLYWCEHVDFDFS